MTNPFDMKFFEGAIGAVLGSVATLFVFKNRVKNLENEHSEFRKETQEMFREIREDIKVLLSRRQNNRHED